VLERRQYARRELWGAAALDEPDQGVQVNRALARELLGQLGVEAGLAQTCAAPGDNLDRSSASAGLVCGSEVHISLALPSRQFLHPCRLDLRGRVDGSRHDSG
jgi:hypothetical protein